MQSQNEDHRFILSSFPEIAIQERMATFVIRGDLSTIDADVYLLPTDAYGDVTRNWQWLAGKYKDEILARKDRLRDGEPILLKMAGERLTLAVNVGGAEIINSTQDLRMRFRTALGRLDEFIQRLTDQGKKFGSAHRARPLLAMPVIGVGAGGLRDDTGDVLRMILEVLNDERRSGMSFDVVIVCVSASDFAALQDIRRRIGPPADPIVMKLAENGQRGDLSVMFGAGASMPLGLPSWEALIRKIGKELDYPEDALVALSKLGPIDSATILRQYAGSDEKFQDVIAAHVETSRCSLTHALIATLQPRVAITTNYDRGYEIAQKSITGREPAVLPWDRVTTADRGYLLKLHGDVSRGQIVLARDDFASVHVRNRPLIGVVQERLLAGHLLTIGSTVSDPTLIQAAEEVGALLDRMTHERNELNGTVILTEDNTPQTILLERNFAIGRAQPASTRLSYQSGPPDSVLDAARRVDILLDRINMYVSSAYSYALTPRYLGMLSDEDSVVRDALNDLKESIKNSPRHIEQGSLVHLVDDFLTSLGADPPLNSKEAESHETSIKFLDFWSNKPAIIETGTFRAPLRKFEVVEVLGDSLVVRVHFLNEPAITRRIYGFIGPSIDSDPCWILTQDPSPLHVSPATTEDFPLGSDIKVPPPPGAMYALMEFMEIVITEWEGDETPDPENPFYWDPAEEGYDPIESLLAFRHETSNTVEAIHYVVNPSDPHYRAVWRDGEWIDSPDLPYSDDNNKVTIAQQNAEVFFKLYLNHKDLPIELAVLASLDPNKGYFRGDFSEDMRAWISNIEAVSIARNPRSQSSVPELTIIESFLEGAAELGGDFLFEAIVDTWEGIQ